MHRVGIGQDSHWFDDDNKPLVLGGVKISATGGLKGNSDGDAVLHSLCNALSSSIGGDSLGTWSDKMCSAGVKDSKKYVEYIYKRVKNLSYRVSNVAIAVEAKKPYFKTEFIQLMKKQIAQLMEINIEDVGITFTSGEGLTSFGKGLGIQVLTVISIVRSNV